MCRTVDAGVQFMCTNLVARMLELSMIDFDAVTRIVAILRERPRLPALIQLTRQDGML